MSDWWTNYQAREAKRMAELKESLVTGALTETDSEDVIICPYCGCDDSDDRYPGEGEDEFTCGHCEKEYVCNTAISVSYSTSRKEEV